MTQFGGLPLNGLGRTTYAKELDPREQRARVLVVVKASPNPSTQYGDTVCVAGIRMRDDGPEWIRLYPVPFRSLEREWQFRKYELIDVDVVPNAKDPRAESYRPRVQSIETREHLTKWGQRHPYMEPLTDEWTMCGILNARQNGMDFPSLAVVRPGVVKRMTIENHPGWTPDQVAAMQRHSDQGDLLAQNVQQRPVLEAPLYNGVLQYECMALGCKGHRGSIHDWEFTALERRVRDRGSEQARELLRQRFFDEMCAPRRQPLLIVGNQQKRPQAFSILGIYRTA
jgi:hypothetical protein